eukprot:TRINITY_DN41358_c0_g1_i1.p1 TRINITY_DN41358_c0_g1~~TRINITY_DN41358_c0_g1_i1.p1  ORF type:complete len:187 (-),score=20.39 TRINITY_DN41358_c0_g1_i1:416-976(-)
MVDALRDASSSMRHDAKPKRMSRTLLERSSDIDIGTCSTQNKFSECSVSCTSTVARTQSIHCSIVSLRSIAIDGEIDVEKPDTTQQYSARELTQAPKHACCVEDSVTACLNAQKDISFNERRNVRCLRVKDISRTSSLPFNSGASGGTLHTLDLIEVANSTRDELSCCDDCVKRGMFWTCDYEDSD